LLHDELQKLSIISSNLKIKLEGLEQQYREDCQKFPTQENFPKLGKNGIFTISQDKIK